MESKQVLCLFHFLFRKKSVEFCPQAKRLIVILFLTVTSFYGRGEKKSLFRYN